MLEAASITIQRSDGGPNEDRWAAISADFTNQMFSLLHISETLLPKTKLTPEEYLELRIKKIAELLSPEEVKEFSDALSWLLKNTHTAPSALSDITSNGRTSSHRKLLDISGLADSASHDSETEDAKNTTSDGLSIASSNVSAAMIEFIHDMATGIMRTNHGTLRKSLLVTAVSNFEILFGKLAQEIYKTNKSALNDSDYSFTLQELAQFDSLEDAREFLIERRVSALMRESVDGWDRWLGKSVKGASMADTPVDWPVTREVFARRNLLVHNGGTVNQIYLSIVSRLDNSPHAGAKIGSKLKVEAEYFSAAV
ncbi:hypothetical protein, partial [Streptomyces nigra]